MVYRPNSATSREAEDYLRDFTRRTALTLEVLDPDTSEGQAFCELYDVVEFPSIVALDDAGKLMQIWRGLPLPLFDEVAYYAAGSS